VYFSVNVSYFSQRHSAVMTLLVMLLVVNTLPLFVVIQHQCCNT